MKIQKLILLTFTHVSMLACGFAIGVYVLPILTAPPSPSVSDIKAVSIQADYKTEFIRELKGSDALHWGEGNVSLNENYVTYRHNLSKQKLNLSG